MSALTLAHFLGHIQDIHAVVELQALAAEIAAAYPDDEATPRLTGVIAAKVARIVGSN